MTEEEFDLQLTRRIGAYAHTKRPPEDFAGRFVGTLRRRRRVRREHAARAKRQQTAQNKFLHFFIPFLV